MERNLCLGCEGKSIVNCRVNVVEDVECSIPVAFGWFVIVGQQEGVGWGEVGPCALSQPTDRTNHTLVLLLAFEECKAVIGLIRFRARIDGEPQSIGSGIGSDIPPMDVVVFDKVSREAGLPEMNQYWFRGPTLYGLLAGTLSLNSIDTIRNCRLIIFQ